MAKKKKRKVSVVNGVPKVEELEETSIIEVPLVCTCVGQKMKTAGGYIGVVQKQKYVKDLDMLLVYFENGYCVNNKICKIVEEE